MAAIFIVGQASFFWTALTTWFSLCSDVLSFWMHQSLSEGVAWSEINQVCNVFVTVFLKLSRMRDNNVLLLSAGALCPFPLFQR